MRNNKYSPWGLIKNNIEITKGVYQIETINGNGGIIIHKEKAKSLLTPYAQKCCFIEGDYLYYEKPYQEPVIMYELMKRGIVIMGNQLEIQCIEEKIKCYNPQYWNSILRNNYFKKEKKKIKNEYQR